jgi:arylsulfatase B
MKSLFLTGLVLLTPWAAFAQGANTANCVPDRPNILVIVSDNQGWNDIGYHGSEVRTPVLDRMAAVAVRLNHFYVFPMCSPTRVGFISGRNPSRYGILGAIGQRSRQALPPETVTIADMIKAQGYETAIVGKWHLGLRPEVGPRQYGFDQTYGYLHGQIDKYTHRYKNGDRSWHRNDRLIDEEGHATDLFEAEAIRFLEQKRDRPFFLYLPFSAPHPPLQEEEKWVKPYKGNIVEESRRLYAASLTHMDSAIGNVIRALERTGQRKKTMIVFFSDNGAAENGERREDQYDGRFGPYPVLGDNSPLRGWIGDLYDGNLRTPAFVYWPEILKPRVVDEVTSVLDWYPTLVALAGGRPADELRLEGRNIWPLLTGERDVEEIVVYCKRSSGKQATVRHDGWKLVTDLVTGDNELFDMEADPSEQLNLAERFPKRVASLKQLLDKQLALDPE